MEKKKLEFDLTLKPKLSPEKNPNEQDLAFVKDWGSKARNLLHCIYKEKKGREDGQIAENFGNREWQLPELPLLRR